MLAVELLPDRIVPALASSAGVVYVVDDATGATLGSYQMDPGFSGPLFVAGLANADGDFLVGAGAGGGPRVVRVDYATGRDVWSVFVGDPQSRTGVSVADWTGYQTPVNVHPDAAAPGAVGAVAAAVSRLPDSLEALLAPRVDVDVFTPAGPTHGGEGSAAYYGDTRTIRVATNYAQAIPHEVGHAAEDFITPAEHADWLGAFSRIDWRAFPFGAATLDYFQSDEHEAFAESFGLAVTGRVGELPAEVGGYMAGIRLAHGWTDH